MNRDQIFRRLCFRFLENPGRILATSRHVASFSPLLLVNRLPLKNLVRSRSVQSLAVLGSDFDGANRVLRRLARELSVLNALRH